MSLLLDCARRAADEAGKIILGYFNTGVEVMEKSSNNLVTRADLESEERILSCIKETIPVIRFVPKKIIRR